MASKNGDLHMPPTAEQAAADPARDDAAPGVSKEVWSKARPVEDEMEYFEPYDPGEFHPGSEEKHSALVRGAKKALITLIANHKLDEVKDALKWLAEHPHALNTLFSSAYWTIHNGVPRQLRRNMIDRRQWPTLSPSEVNGNQFIFGEITGWLVRNLESDPNLKQHLGTLPEAALESLTDAHLLYLWTLFRTPTLTSALLPWEAVAIARKARRRAPSWAVDAILACAEQVAAVQKATNPEKQYCVALGFSTFKAGPNPATTARRKAREKIEIFALLQSARADTDSASHAFEKVVELRRQKDRSTYYAIEAEFKALLATLKAEVHL